MPLFHPPIKYSLHASCWWTHYMSEPLGHKCVSIHILPLLSLFNVKVNTRWNINFKRINDEYKKREYSIEHMWSILVVLWFIDLVGWLTLMMDDLPYFVVPRLWAMPYGEQPNNELYMYTC